MSFTKLIYHIVFSPKDRAKVIRQTIERDFYMMIYKIILRHNGYVHRIGGMEDHVHLLVELPAQASLTKFVHAVKRESSTSARTIIHHWPGWQEGYGAFTVGFAELERIKNYIANQKEHHAMRSFIDEYRQWLLDNGISPDEPYFPK